MLYGLMTQSQAPPTKNDSTSKLEVNNKSSSDAKSRVSSPASNSSASAAVPQNSSSSAAPLSAVGGFDLYCQEIISSRLFLFLKVIDLSCVSVFNLIL